MQKDLQNRDILNKIFMHDAGCLNLWHESGEYLVLLQEYGGGGNRFRLDCQGGNSEKVYPRRGKLDKCHWSKQR